MTNTALFHELLNQYNALSFTHEYILGFEFDSNIYMATVDAEILPFVTCLDKASRGAGYSLRFKPTKAQKSLLMTYSKVLCSAKFFHEETAESKYNKGEIFEKMVTESFGQEWEKDSVPFTEAGDVEYKGVAYQIKFESATFTNEKILQRFTRNA